MASWKLMQHVPTAVFVFAFGAIVGSFINVVIYRLPAGMSVISPPSRCPVCGARLSWLENLPILGWFLVRGRCRHCRTRVSPQYTLIEAFMAVLFAGIYWTYYVCAPGVTWWGDVGGEWWHFNWILRTLPGFVAVVFLLAGLTAMTVIDARTFEIQIRIPVVLTTVAFVAWPLQALLPVKHRTLELWPIPTTGWAWFAAGAGGMLGVLGSTWLLRRGVLRYSFADYEQYLGEGEVLADYPHARREMGVELLFLAPVIAGICLGYVAGRAVGGVPSPVLQALGGSMLGYLTGAGMVWAVRILGTLGFGREAMGLGDVHLMGAVGAVLGWVDPIFVFLLAPFFGLSWVVLSMGISSLFRKKRRELPYGPHLAVATLTVLLCRPAINWIQANYLPGLQQPGISRPVSAPGGPGP